MITSAFTCTGPYAILILRCSKSFCREEYGEFVRWASRALKPEEFETVPAWDEVKDWPGKVVGCCDYEAGTRGSAFLPWDEGYGYWWNLSKVVALDRPIPCRGNVGMWQMPSELAAQVTAADRLAQAVGERIAFAADAAELFRLAVPVADGSEGFFVLPLNEERRVLSEPILVSLGTSSVSTAVQPGEVFGAALKADAKAVIVAHNHPSGNTTPSVQDRELTAALKRLGEALGVTVLDHLVIGDGSFATVE